MWQDTTGDMAAGHTTGSKQEQSKKQQLPWVLMLLIQLCVGWGSLMRRPPPPPTPPLPRQRAALDYFRLWLCKCASTIWKKDAQQDEKQVRVIGATSQRQEVGSAHFLWR